mgnify:CR=1 FL=1
MPGPKPRTRPAETGPQDPPDIVGGGLGRQRRDVSHRRSRKGAGGQIGEVSARKGWRLENYKQGGRLFTTDGRSPGWNGWFG